jgi:hypothetical protein
MFLAGPEQARKDIEQTDSRKSVVPYYYLAHMTIKWLLVRLRPNFGSL